jgi:transcriptional antiterminator RfaH
MQKPLGEHAAYSANRQQSTPRAQQAARWYVVRTQPHREPSARAHLENQRYRVFLPTRLKTVRHARKLRTTVSPLFPQYMFIELDLSVQRWRNINGTCGVDGLVMSGGRPQAVPAGIVEPMLAAADSRGMLRVEQSLKPGERVRLTAGAFAEQLGILVSLDDSNRIRVLLEMMGGQIAVEVPREFVMTAA